MMNRSPLGRMVTQHRWGQHAATLLYTVFAGGLTLIVLLDQTPPPRRSNPSDVSIQRSERKRTPLAKPSTLSVIRNTYDTEEAAWSNTFQWISQHQVTSGRCTFNQDLKGYGVQCINNDSSIPKQSIAPWAPMALSLNIFKLSKPSVLGSHDEPEKSGLKNQGPEDSIQHRGWIATRQGLRHYDAEHRTWLAPGHRP